MALTELDEAILDAATLPMPARLRFAADHGMSSPRFHQRLLHLIQTPEAEVARPAMVHRMQRIMEKRRVMRTMPAGATYFDF